MPFKVTVPKKLQALFNARSRKSLVAQTRKRFSTRGVRKVKQAINQDMIRGISPVKGAGRWVRYSKSYKDQIKGRVRFFTIHGKVVAVKAGRGKRVTNDVIKNASPTKQIGPVNLRLSGKLHKSLKVFTTGGFLSSFRMLVQFRNKLADIHNRRGAGKSKVVRRLLPTRRGENFNKRISDVIFLEMKKAADFVAKQFSGQ